MGEWGDFVFLGPSIKQWLFAAAFGAGGFILGKICSGILAAALKAIRGKGKAPIDGGIIRALRRSLWILISIGGFALGFRALNPRDPIRPWGDKIAASLFIMVIASGISRVIDAFIARLIPEKGSGTTPELSALPVLRRLGKTLVWIIGGILILRILGYNISALLAGLGLGGAALALASKDTLSNFFGSITVFVDRPFRLNDRIKVSGYDGVITEMGLRTSRLRTMENRTLIIPNSIFAANPIENVSAEPNTRVSQTLYARRDNGPEKIALGVSLLRDICLEAEGTDGDPAAGLAAIRGIACHLTLVYYVAKGANYLDTVHRINMEILRRFEEAGICLV
jgi:MscS family membrane protein